jgi:1,4-alpha-glucan branching enzyme
MHTGLRRWVLDLNHTYRQERSLHQMDFDGVGFAWIDCHDNENSVVSLIRRARDPRDFTVMVANFTPVPRPAYRIGVPDGGWYSEMLNSDAALYGGSNMGNGGGVHTDPIPDHGYEQSISLIVPPLGFVLLKRS